MKDKIHELLDFWFGQLGVADLPASDRTRLWFGENSLIKERIALAFQVEYDNAIAGKLSEWASTPRGRLALIILLDQFSRYINRTKIEAYAFDAIAQQLTLEGIELQMDRALTLIERVFFYIPLVHSENLGYQNQAVKLYQQLVELSMPESTPMYQLFLAYAFAHCKVITEFGRFPQRNKIMGRESSLSEVVFLKKA
jgi:uncharacterized protein (DUF924 family)